MPSLSGLYRHPAIVAAPMQAPEASTPADSLRVRSLLARMRASEGVRAGVILSIATVILNGSAYIYAVACIRYLGSRGYGDVAAMLALFSLVSLPLVSIQ